MTAPSLSMFMAEMTEESELSSLEQAADLDRSYKESKTMELENPALAAHRECNDVLRSFETGATRDTESGKIDPEGFLSPTVIRRFSDYMHKHRQTPGGLRDSDNWQRGMPRAVYMKSMWRHFLDVWEMHRDPDFYEDDELEDALCAMFFNVQGMLHEILLGRDVGKEGV